MLHDTSLAEARVFLLCDVLKNMPEIPEVLGNRDRFGDALFFLTP